MISILNTNQSLGCLISKAGLQKIRRVKNYIENENKFNENKNNCCSPSKKTPPITTIEKKNEKK